MINPNQLGRSPFPAGASQWMLVGLRGGAAPPPGLNDGDPVSSWTDSSGNGHTATQSGTARPTFKTNIINGKPVVRFTSAGISGLNLVSTISGAPPWEVFVVMKATGPAVKCWSINAAVPDASPFGPVELNGNLYVAGRSEYVVVTTDYSGAFHVITAGYASAATFGMLVDGSALTLPAPTALAATTANFGIIGYRGDSLYTDGDIAEIIIYNVIVSTTDRQNIEKYLGTKYGITVAGGTTVQPDTVTGLVGWWKADSLL